MLDNGSRDGSAQAAQAHPAVDEVIALGERRGKGAERHRAAAARARAATRCCSTRTPSCSPARRALCTRRWSRATRGGLRAAPSCCAPTGLEQPSAWRFPTPPTALAGALFLHRAFTVQSKGSADARGRLVPVSRAARPPRGRNRRSAGSTRPSSSTPTRSTSPGACATPAGAACTCRRPWRSTTSSSRPAPCPSGGSWSCRATATCYMRKHHSRCGRADRARADRLGVRRARARGPRAARPLPAALLAPRHSHAAPRPRRGPARGRG